MFLMVCGKWANYTLTLAQHIEFKLFEDVTTLESLSWHETILDFVGKPLRDTNDTVNNISRPKLVRLS